MKSFIDIPNILGSWPNVLVKNCTGAGATDGTPYIQEWANNFWGWAQTLMARVGITPSSVLENYAAENAFAHSAPGEATMRRTAGQLLTALQMQFTGPGEFVGWMRSQAPAVVGARVLLLQGQTIAVASYPDLCNAVYVGDALNNTAGVPFYLSSDSGGVTRSTTGAYLTLPDARGVTLRGIDTAQARDPLGNSRGGAAGAANGSVELDAFQGHLHLETGYSGTGGGAAGLVGAGSNTTPWNSPHYTAVPITDGITYEGKVNAAVRLAVETRMINMACYIGIRY